MKKIFIISFMMLIILFVAIFLLMKNNEQKDTSISGGSDQSSIEFSATLIEPPKKVDQTDDYFILFDDVKVVDEKDQNNLDTFNEGGRLITTLPTNKEIRVGDKIVVRVHKDFATTRSIPPQIIGNSVISVSFQ